MTWWTRAFLLAPLATPLLYAAGSLLEALADPVRRSYATQNLWGGVLMIFMFGAPIAYGAALVLGLPALCLLRRAGALTWWSVLILGAVIGLAVAAVLTPQWRGDLISVPMGPWRGAWLGAATAGVWYGLAMRDVRRT